MRNYNRQQVFDQTILENAKITIVGAGALSNYLCLYLSGIGIRNINLISDENYEKENNEFLLKNFKGSKAKGIEEKINKINPEMDITSINSHLIDFLIGQPDVLVDLTNDNESKKKCKNIAKKKNIKRFISAYSSENNGSIRAYDIVKRPLILKKNKPKILTLRDSLTDYQNYSQGNFTSGIIAAIALDEIRKTILPLKNEHRLKEADFSLHSKKRFNSGLRFDEKKESLSGMKALVVGAGGIGTYVCLNLSLMNIDRIDLYDGDVIEDHNLNRQVFYYDAIGRKKADILSERLNCIKSYPKYLTDTSKLKKYDVIFSCLDNWKYRFMLSNYAVKNKIPFINGSVTTFNAYADFYSCLSCNYNRKKMLENEKPEEGSCNNITNSNVVMTNAFVGALMASETKAIAFPNEYKKLYKKELSYNSQSIDSLKFSISNQILSCTCHKKEKGCKCHEKNI